MGAHSIDHQMFILNVRTSICYFDVDMLSILSRDTLTLNLFEMSHIFMNSRFLRLFFQLISVCEFIRNGFYSLSCFLYEFKTYFVGNMFLCTLGFSNVTLEICGLYLLSIRPTRYNVQLNYLHSDPLLIHTIYNMVVSGGKGDVFVCIVFWNFTLWLFYVTYYFQILYKP